MSTQIVLAPTLQSMAVAVVAIDRGLLGMPERRLLLSVNDAAIPELTSAPHELPGAEALLDRFDGVITYTDVVAPTLPSQWRPRQEDLPVFERLLRRHWGLGGDAVELVLESLSSAPAATMARIFEGAAITAYAADLTVYGPTPAEVPFRTWRRLTTLLYADLVEGLEPLLLSEYGVDARAIPAAAVAALLAHGADDTAPAIDPVQAAIGTVTASLLVGAGSEDIRLSGTRDLLSRLSPYENRHRVPLVIAHALTDPSRDFAQPARLQELVTAVAYCQQPEWLAALRPQVERFLESMPDLEQIRHYLYFRRMRALRLPGVPQTSSQPAPVEPGAVGRARAVAGRLRRSLASAPRGDTQV